MSIQSKHELDALREAGRIVRATLNAMEAAVRPGVTTKTLNTIGAEILHREGAQSAPKLMYGFPADVCISVNEEIVHGIPSDRVLQMGDLVKLDVVAVKEGYMADAAVTVAVGEVDAQKQALMDCAKAAFYKGLQVARAGNRVNHIGKAVERTVRKAGFAVVRELAGHGIGRMIHEEPTVPNYNDFRARQRLTNGLVITIEPMVVSKRSAVVEAEDGWTIKTTNGAWAAHYEHTLVITKRQPMLLTA